MGPDSFLASKIKDKKTRLIVFLISFNLIVILAKFCSMTFGKAFFFALLTPLYSMAIKPVFNFINKQKDELLSMEKLEFHVTVFLYSFGLFYILSKISGLTFIALLVNIAVIVDSEVIDLGIVEAFKGLKEHMANMVTDYLEGKKKKEEKKEQTK